MYIHIPRNFQHLFDLLSNNLQVADCAHPVDLKFVDTDIFSIFDGQSKFEFEVPSKFVRLKHDCLQLFYYPNNTISQASDVCQNLVTIGFPDPNNEGHFFDRWFDDVEHKISYSYQVTDRDDFNQRHLSWFISLIVLGYALEDAILLANTIVCCHVSRETWSNHLALPYATVDIKSTVKSSRYLSDGKKKDFKSLHSNRIGLYPVVDNLALLEELLALGVGIIQLRIKDSKLSIAQIEKLIIQSIELGKSYNSQVFINDYWQLAIKHEAYGVHLGQEDIYYADLNAIQCAGLALGISTHSYYEIMRAIEVSPSYIALGHVFATPTKVMKSKPQGLCKLSSYVKLIQAKCPHIPTVAIGGIDSQNADQIISTGVGGVAVVRAVSDCSDLANTVGYLSSLTYKNNSYDEVNHVR
ncbi:thiamine phosphate synthase [Vibrio sp. TH_r3]|uniref:thiamine phosphate synthase n=1 Tax=Vibrio sp. TH_r3 TaxID=3082084 RepID=UPI002953E002|nr:thiamine phosphate synthase [Vibrio sp. TH_r3]MDV7106217.1 thiamine phosphate synthase [Vibrio sp. TH_r3]